MKTKVAAVLGSLATLGLIAALGIGGGGVTPGPTPIGGSVLANVVDTDAGAAIEGELRLHGPATVTVDNTPDGGDALSVNILNPNVKRAVKIKINGQGIATLYPDGTLTVMGDLNATGNVSSGGTGGAITSSDFAEGYESPGVWDMHCVQGVGCTLNGQNGNLIFDLNSTLLEDTSGTMSLFATGTLDGGSAFNFYIQKLGADGLVIWRGATMLFAVGSDGTIHTAGGLCFGFGNDAGCQQGPSAPSTSGAYPIDSHTIGQWTMEETPDAGAGNYCYPNHGVGRTCDAGPCDMNLCEVNTYESRGVPGPFGNAARLTNNLNGAWKTRPGVEIVPPGAWTISVWNKASVAYWQVAPNIVTVGSVTSGRSIAIRGTAPINLTMAEIVCQDSANYQAIWDNGTSAYSLAQQCGADRQWHYYAATWTASGGVSFYFDGELVSHADTPGCTSTKLFSDSEFWIGQFDRNGFSGAWGVVADARIEDVARTPAEIKEAYWRGNPMGTVK